MQTTLFLAKKLVVRLPPVVAATPSSNTSVFYLSDTKSGIRFLVDTGACRSLCPPTLAKHNNDCKPHGQLTAANGSPILIYGSTSLSLFFNGRQFEWDFIIAQVCIPILGADFLAHFKLLVDMANHRLIDATSLESIPIAAAPNDLALQATDPSDAYRSLLSSFPDVFKPVLRHQPHTAAKHDVRHHIKTSGPPVFARFRRLAPAKLAAAKKVFIDMEKMGICQKASSPWASPLHIVTKKDGSLRPCGDYRRLNMQTEPDHYPLPNITDVTSYLHGAQIFSKLDLLKGYYQVPMNPADIPKTAITTPFGTYTFNYSCFGLRNSGATFQRLMDGILGDFPFCVCYVDDILVFSTSEEEHMNHLHAVLDRLQKNGLVIRYDKCVFGSEKIEFLGHQLSSSGVSPLPAKVDAVRHFPTPTSVKSLQEFVGMINYYHRFVPGIAAILSPLYASLSGKPKSLTWGTAQDQAFKDAKEALASATLLCFPDPGGSLSLTTDASSVAVGAVLEQEVKGHLKPIAFFSRKLHDREQRYSTFDRELLAIHLAVRHFRHLLEGVPFTIFTDHLPLVHAFTNKTDPHSNRQQNQLSAIAEYNCVIRHIPGKNNPVADALSRNIISMVHLGLDCHALAKEQLSDNETLASRSSLTSMQWQDVPIDDKGTTLLCDVSTGRPRPWIPPAFRRTVFDLVHGLSHPSRRATATLLKQRFVWYGIAKDAKAWSRSCMACQTSKIHRHTESGVGSFKQPPRRFSHIHVDIVGPLPSSEDHRYLFTIVDRSTRWPEAIPMKNSTTESCVNALLAQWIARFGLPDDITSDRGTPFRSQLWTSLARLLGTTLHHTTAYNPEGNGMVERLHRTLKAALISRCTSPDWFSQLPWVLLGLRTTPKEGTGVSSAEMVYGDPLHVPADFFPAPHINDDLDRLRQVVKKFVPCQPTYKDSTKMHIPKDLSSSSHVFLRVDARRAPLSPPYTGPFKVLQRREKTFLLDIRGSSDWISIDRLKPAYLLDDDTPTVRLTRAGRPTQRPSRFSFSGEGGGGVM